VLLLSSPVQARAACAVEVKLLLASTATPAAIASFQLVTESTGQVYFFDTDSLNLLSKGVIVRLRQGADNDLTVKVRPPRGKKFADPTGGHENFKCEMDLIGGEMSPSYSIARKNSGARATDTGAYVFSRLSAGQRKLLKEAGASMDWTRVRRIADIKSTDWDTWAQAPFGKLTLELWEWPRGSILEVSTRVGPHSGTASYAELVRLANANSLSINASQLSKTRMVLESLTRPTTP